MSIFKAGYYRHVKNCFLIIGTWPKQSKKVSYTLRVTLIGILTSSIIPAYIHIFNVWGNYNETIPCLAAQGTVIIAFIKYFLLIAQPNMISKILNRINDDWKLYNRTKKISEVMHHHAASGSRFTLIYLYSIFTAGVVWTTASYVPVVLDIVIPMNESREKKFAYEVDYVIDSQNYYNWIQIHCLMAVLVTDIFVCTTDCFIVMMVEHCSSLFHIVGIILRELETENSNITEKYEKNIISRAIVVHQNAISLAELIEKFVTIMYGGVFLVNMIVISIGGFHMILRWDDKREVIRMLLFLITLSLILLFNTLPSQQLINSSGNVFYRIADCQWNKLTLKSQILIQIMLIRSTQTNTLTAGKVYPINMENFSKIMKTSMSYFTVLKSMQ
ncbi:hypothetical protein HCN44_001232 [Aphidius gifuensis]|uniref:Odorant receptor n=1 Tax=Aphidius gifuensis TaxID=684658 RepID=A0A834XNS8_APHGI|nr:hypothetical protein HCN44_001232 [Aphidius gifuensis]